MRDFLEIEKKHDLYHIEIDGVNIWQYFRVPLWYELLGEKKSLDQNAYSRPSKQAKLKILLKKIMYILMHQKKIHKSDILFVNFGRRIKKDGVYVDKYTGELENYFCNKFIIIEYNGDDSLPLRPTQSQREYYPELLWLIVLAKTKIGYFFNAKEYRSARKEVEESFTIPLKEIIERYKFELDLQSLFHDMAMQVIKIKRFKKSYVRLLNKIEPKVIIEIMNNSRPSMIINEIAKEMVIPTIELQHGISVNSIIWNYADGCGVIPQFPDYVFGYSDFFNSFMNPPIPRENLKVVGLPYLEQALSLYPKRKEDQRITILFISQPLIAAQLSKLAVEIREMLAINQYRIIYKLHPQEVLDWKEKMPWLYNKAIDVIDDRAYETYKCYAESDVQVGEWSTAIFEGLMYDLDTYIYKIGQWEEMSIAVELGYAAFITDANDFINKLNSGAKIKRQVKEFFWKENAVNNMVREIEQISGVRGKWTQVSDICEAKGISTDESSRK